MTIEQITASGGVVSKQSSDAGGVTTPVQAPGGFGNAALLTPSDTVDFTNEVQALYVGGTGNVEVVLPDGTTALFSAVPVGTLLPVRAKRINATATTGTLLVGMW